MAEATIEEIREQLDQWKVPKQSGISQGRLNTLGRVRLLRNNDLIALNRQKGRTQRAEKRLAEMEALVIQTLRGDKRARQLLAEMVQR